MEQTSKYSPFRLRNPLTLFSHICYAIVMNYITKGKQMLSKIFGDSTPTVFSEEEQQNSNRIFKSKTPKYDFSWYLKWIASFFVLGAMSVRGVVELVYYDMVLTIIGLSLWLWVSFLWRDRALIILNGVGLLFVIRNFVEYLAGV